MAKKQFIKASNTAPSMMLNFPWLLSLTAYTFHWPVWVYGIIGTLTVLFVITFIIRSVTEEGVDVVDRNG